MTEAKRYPGVHDAGRLDYLNLAYMQEAQLFVPTRLVSKAFTSDARNIKLGFCPCN
jgi:hypothetical protein